MRSLLLTALSLTACGPDRSDLGRNGSDADAQLLLGLEDDDAYGEIEGIAFTIGQAAATVDLVNSVTLETLDDDLGLDSRAAENLVALRPFDTVDAIAEVPYVGPSALTKLRDAAVPSSDSVADALTDAAEGLWWMSEADYPIEVFVIAEPGPISTANAKAVLAEVYVQREYEATLEERVVEQWTVDRALDRYTVVEDWWSAEQHADATRWQAVRDVFEHDLTDATVFRFGEGEEGWLSGGIDVFILGVAANGDLVGLHTVSVET